ncbi:MAG TPA: RNase A-like domain-containing protein [Terriglobales bacterium]|nr:RNase A-like domain-containing protein [Terriglobales bacterium]
MPPTLIRKSALAGFLLGLMFLSGACQKVRTGGAPTEDSGLAAAGPVHDLSEDEARGGHTLRKHVGKTDDELRARLQDEPNITAASTYNDRATAESVVGSVLQQDRAKIERWLDRSSGHPNLVLYYDGDPAHPIGRSLGRGQSQGQPCSHAVVIFRWMRDREYYVLTSYPECC